MNTQHRDCCWHSASQGMMDDDSHDNRGLFSVSWIRVCFVLYYRINYATLLENSFEKKREIRIMLILVANQTQLNPHIIAVER